MEMVLKYNLKKAIMQYDTIFKFRNMSDTGRRRKGRKKDRSDYDMTISQLLSPSPLLPFPFPLHPTLPPPLLSLSPSFSLFEKRRGEEQCRQTLTMRMRCDAMQSAVTPHHTPPHMI